MVQVSLLGRLCAPHCLAIDEHFLPCLEPNEWSFLSPENGDSLLGVWKRDKNLMRWFHNTCGKWTLLSLRLGCWRRKRSDSEEGRTGSLSPRGRLFSEGGAGDPPAQLGDPPGGMALMSGCEKTVPFRSVRLPVPSGGPPDGTGGSPVLPNCNAVLMQFDPTREGGTFERFGFRS
jgi:hypothetical protein